MLEYAVWLVEMVIDFMEQIATILPLHAEDT